MSSEFVGKRILVTGGGNGLGKAIVQKFYEAGANVFVLDCDEEALKQLKIEFPNVTPISADLGSWDASRKAVEAILPLNHLVNNAATASHGDLLEVSPEYIDRIFAVNFKAAFNMTQIFAKGIIENQLEGGTIVNISSFGDRVSLEGFSAYCCTKAALAMLTKSSANELGKLNIRVNSIRPIAMNTQLFRQVVSEPEFVKRVGELMGRAVLKKPLEISDAANLVYFLSSSQSSVMTGEDVALDAGLGIA